MSLKPRQPRNDGSHLTGQDIDELRVAIKGSLIVRGETSEDEYTKAISRWNEVYVQQAVSWHLNRRPDC